jgi:hypothetical protein
MGYRVKHRVPSIPPDRVPLAAGTDGAEPAPSERVTGEQLGDFAEAKRSYTDSVERERLSWLARWQKER